MPCIPRRSQARESTGPQFRVHSARLSSTAYTALLLERCQRDIAFYNHAFKSWLHITLTDVMTQHFYFGNLGD